MQRYLPFPVVFTILVLFCACRKKNDTGECFPGSPTVRQIVNKPAVVKVTATVTPVYLVEEGTIDTRLIPCNLPMEFLQHDLQVIISGDIKATSQGAGPCCDENFVITKISR